MSFSLPGLPDSRPTELPNEAAFQRKLWRGTLWLALGIGVPALALLLLVVFLLHSAALLEETNETLAQAEHLQTLVVDMETGLRGFQATDDQRFLEPFRAAHKQVDGQLERLAQRSANEPESRRAVEALRAAFATWREYADEALRIEKSGAPGRTVPFLLRGKAAMDEVRGRIADVMEAGHRQRAREAGLHHNTRWLVLAGLAVMALVGAPLAFIWVRGLLRNLAGSYEAGLALVRRRAQELHITLRSIGDAVVATNAAGEVVFLNPIAERLMGWTTAEAEGRPLSEVFQIFNETTGAPAENPVIRVLRERVVVGLANHTVVRSRTGMETPIEDSAAPILDDTGKILGVILVFHDVGTKRAAEETLRRSERRFRLLNVLGEATRQLTEPRAIMAAVTRELGTHLQASRCAYAEVNPETEHFRIIDDYTDGCASTVGNYELPLFGRRAAAEMRAGRTLQVADVDVELSPEDGANTFNAIGIKALICCPLIRDGRLRAMMAVHQTTPRSWSPEEVVLVEEVVKSSWAIIERATAEAEVRERARLSALRADIASQLSSSADLEASLQSSCELLVRHLGVAFARVWTIPPGDPVLLLRASAGLYTHLDGPHSRIPVGDFKIGRIAQSGKPLLTNQVVDDPNISDTAWARREGMVAFAGYPLLSGNRTVGVLAMFAQQPLQPATLNDLAPIADSLALYIERKRAELELRQATARAEANARAVAESGERFRLLAEVVSLQVWTARLDGTLDFVNQECVQYFGAADLERDVLGHAWAQFVHPEDLPVAQSRWAEALTSGERYEVEFRLRHHAGDYRWFLVRAQAMREAAGHVVKWFGTNTDIHALKLAQGEAERASRAKDEFLAALSHELRTPLTPVLMTAAALREDTSLPAAVREQLGMMERNIALEARLIDDLLDLTRIARGKLDVRRQPCDTHSLISLAIEIVRDDSLAKHISVTRDFKALYSGLEVDPARFQQVIWNLVRNAVKFTPREGNITIHTYDEVGPDGVPSLNIAVTDSGIGISPSQLEKIFLPFEQGGLTGDHRFGGIGLGLAIARAIVELHGGAISASSEGVNRGATFIVTFPGATKPAAGAVETAAPLLPSGASVPGSSGPRALLRLLLVEDHEATLQVMSRLLVRAGHQVTPASSVAEALAIAAAGQFDLVISDLGLPDGTGTELMRQLRDLHGLRGIALSGYGMDEDVARAHEAGFITHLTKPVDFHQLERALQQIS